MKKMDRLMISNEAEEEIEKNVWRKESKGNRNTGARRRKIGKRGLLSD